MPDILPTINNEPAQGIQALLDTVYLWNQDVANDLIEQINHLLEELGEFSDAGCIKPYSELTAPVRQYMPCYNGDNVYVAAADIETLPEQFNPSQWILIATKAPVLQAGAGIDINGNEISVEQQVLSDAAAGGTAVQPGDLGTAAYAATTDFATAAQGALADTAIQSVKTINGNTITGSGNLVITTFTTYPVDWPTTGTTKAFCDAIAADTSATEGMAYLGEVTLSDLPGGIVNSEIKVEIMSGTTALNKVILLTLTSGNVSPYQWQYTYWNNGSSVSGWVATGAQVNADWTSNSGPSQILHKPAIPDVVDNYNSTSASSALSANMGHDLNQRLTSVEGRGRFLSTWNCATGLAGTNPPTSPYTYKSGDYFIVSQVGATNYKPSGSQYVTGTASSTVETGAVAVNDTYQYDGTNWVLLKNTVDDPLPAQTGNAGKFLTTDGTAASWAGAVPQYSTMPTAGSTNVNEIAQFTGATDSTFTNGYLYKNVQTNHPAATVSQTSGSGFTSLAIDAGYFAEHQQPTGDETIDLTVTGVDAPELMDTSTITGDLEFEVDPVAFNTFIEGLYNGTPFSVATVNLTCYGNNWAVTSGNITLWIPGGTSTEMGYSTFESLASVGITVTGGSETWGTEIQVALYGTWVYLETGDLTDYGVTWKGTPEVDSVVTIDYTEVASVTYAWTPIDSMSAVKNLSQNPTDGVTILGHPNQSGINIGYGSTMDGYYGVAIGDAAYIGQYSGGVALGGGARLEGAQLAVAVGNDAIVRHAYGTAVGTGAETTAYRSIQLGAGVNDVEKTFNVGFGADHNYQLLTYNGAIPAERLTNAPNWQKTILPPAEASNAGTIYQYTGATNWAMVHGYSYECKQTQDGLNYEWVPCDVQRRLDVKVLPTPSTLTVGDIYQYVGETTADYTNGYFYKGIGTTVTTPATGTITNEWPEEAVITINWDALLLAMQEILNLGSLVDVLNAFDWNVRTGQENNYDQGTGILEFQGILVNGIHQPVGLDTAQYPNVFSTTAVDDNGWASFVITSLFGPQSSTVYSWERINTQPEPVIPDPLPSQTGNAGKFLTTNGTNTSWATVDALPSQTGQSGKFLTTNGTDASWSDKPLVNTATGTNALTISGTAATVSESVNIGMQSRATEAYSTAVGQWAEAKAVGGTALGRHAVTEGYRGTAVGMQAHVSTTAQYGVAIGFNATASADYAIQLGGEAVSNSNANTFKVANANGNYEMMSANGTIPTARFATDPVSDGAYIPTVTLSSGTATRSWEAPTTITFRTWGANE